MVSTVTVRGSRLLSWRWGWAKSDLVPVVLGATLHRVFLGKIKTGNHGMPWNVTNNIDINIYIYIIMNDDTYHWMNHWDYHNMAMDQYLLIPFLGEWTSINPSYFDVNYRGTRFWHTAIYVCILIALMYYGSSLFYNGYKLMFPSTSSRISRIKHRNCAYQRK